MASAAIRFGCARSFEPVGGWGMIDLWTVRWGMNCTQNAWMLRHEGLIEGTQIQSLYTRYVLHLSLENYLPYREWAVCGYCGVVETKCHLVLLMLIYGYYELNSEEQLACWQVDPRSIYCIYLYCIVCCRQQHVIILVL